MKYLILGGKGMAGHLITSYLKEKGYIVYHTSRNLYDQKSLYLDATCIDQVEHVIHQVKPDVVVNCIGLLNENAQDHPIEAIQLNSLLPKVIENTVNTYGAKLVHISTDCVFSGAKGDYLENDDPDGNSVYSKTKMIGEVCNAPHLTFRTSIIGPELKNGIGLFHWFMKQKGTIKGFTKVPWNGVTTLEIAKAIEEAVKQNLSGLYHLTAPTKISKYDLLMLIKTTFNKEDVTIEPYDQTEIDRTLLNSRNDFSYSVSAYPHMIQELKEWIQQHEK
ncbi:dTDP-4-dehydrorhamnose reductase family protein [Pseudalkalibacillus decolorationis]|uniref:dTDP-4-dehydrorhamnose reductase family protein n=1 Tax=Pseudalkalibacillus decolorationis TaxID=163879 RepID=UPI002148E29E|nr:SDR family oxidoreductase [Pseudalkalibacillus decolorationis]